MLSNNATTTGTELQTAQYTLKGIKTFRGMEGPGLNATLMRGGVRVALIIDEGCGGMMHFDFYDRDERPGFEEFCASWFKESGEADEWDATALGKPNASDMMEYWVMHYVNGHLIKQKLNRAAKKCTLFQLKGDPADEWRTIDSPYSPAVGRWLTAKYGDQVAVIWGQEI